MELTEKLIALRKKAGLSQAELAERIGVSRQAVSRWEVGDAVPSVGNLAALGKLYRVPLEDLLDRGAQFPPPERADIAAREREALERERERLEQKVRALTACVVVLALCAVGIGCILIGDVGAGALLGGEAGNEALQAFFQPGPLEQEYGGRNMIRDYFSENLEAQWFLFGTREGYLIQILPFLLLAGLGYLAVRLAVRWLTGRRGPLLWEAAVLLFVLYLAGVFALWFVPREVWRCLWYWAIFGVWDGEMVARVLTFSFDWFPALDQVLAGERTAGGAVRRVLMGNVMMFIPLGLVTPLLLGERGMGRTLKLGVLLTVLAELARLLLGCGLTVENIAVDLLCVGIGVCLYRTVRDNFAEARLGSGLARE